MKIEIQITSEDLKRLILTYLQDTLPNSTIALDDITIEVKSKQNYKSEWERADFRASITRLT